MDANADSVRIALPEVSRCCCKPMFVGRYSEGGFVKACCEGCGKQTTLSAYDFEKAVTELGLACESCGKTMQPHTNVDGYGNYGLICECSEWVLLADIVPGLSRFPHKE